MSSLTVEDIWRQLWEPPPIQSVSEWAEDNLVLPPSATPEPGKYSADLTPYVKPILDAYNDPTVKFIDMCFSAQSAKTMTMTVMMAHSADSDPMNTIWMFPSTDMSKSHSKTRWQPIVEATPCLREKKPADRHRYQILEQHFSDFTLNFIGGNSATQLASRSAGRVFMDEIDKLPLNLKDEADPCSLLEERTKWYPDAKIVRSSTPTTEEGRIWKYFLQGSMERCHIPCLKCKKYFSPSWENVKWSKDEGLSRSERAETARIQCPDPECAHRMTDGEKKLALREFKWIAENRDADSNHRSFHFNEVLSPLTSLRDLAAKYLKAIHHANNGDTGYLQNFVNSSLGEPWYDDFGSYKRSDTQIDEMRDGRPAGDLHSQTTALTAGIDTQDDGFWYSIRAWGPNMTSWLVDYGFVTSLADIEEVVLNRDFVAPDRTRHKVCFAYIDAAGHRTDEVYEWCRGKDQNLIMPSFGRVNCAAPVSESAIQKSKGNSYSAFYRAIIDTHFFKDAISGRMKVTFGSPGAYYFHNDIRKDYYEQMTAEFKDATGKWKCPSKRDNHIWDCEVYAMAAAYCARVWERVPVNNGNYEIAPFRAEEIETQKGMW